VLGLELRSKHVGGTTVFGLVDGALVDTLLLLGVVDWQCTAVNHRHNRELFLWLGLLQVAVRIPAGSFDLEAEHVGAFAELRQVGLPVHLLEDVSLDKELVELLSLLTGVDLFNSSQERLRVEHAVQEGDSRDLFGVLLPVVQLLKALLQVVQPRVEATGGREGKFCPLARHSV